MKNSNKKITYEYIIKCINTSLFFIIGSITVTNIIIILYHFIK